MGPSFKSLRTISKKASEQLESLAAASELFSKAVPHVSMTAAATKGLAEGLTKVSEGVQDLQEAMKQSTRGLKASISESTTALEDDVKRSSEAAGLLTAKLIEVAQHMIDRTREQRPM